MVKYLYLIQNKYNLISLYSLSFVYLYIIITDLIYITMKNVFDTLTNTELPSIIDDNNSWNNILSKLKPHQKQEL